MHLSKWPEDILSTDVTQMLPQGSIQRESLGVCVAGWLVCETDSVTAPF